MTTATTTRRSRRPRLLRQARVWYRRRHRPRAWWQKALRVAVFAVVLAGGAYVTMPWWLPTRWLGDLIAADLADKTGLDVQIGRVSVSWSGGVELYG
ncbi:MAG TPA: hypothetical protein ENH80_03625, partial [Phycisphaerae bacterium]|nr:hypothetical protein [Phycisphaerae bacterium]